MKITNDALLTGPTATPFTPFWTWSACASSSSHYGTKRWYDPVTGRWLSNDPIGIAGGVNQYVFCENCPVSLLDPEGLWGIQFGDFNVGVGSPSLVFDRSSLMDVSKGAAATIDGMIPFGDPMEAAYADECGRVSGEYEASRFLGGISRDALFVAAGTGAASRLSPKLANSKLVGKGSRLFGRGGQWGQKGILNQGPMRTGWGWKGTREAGRDVFRTSWSEAGKRTYWNHMDWF